MNNDQVRSSARFFSFATQGGAQAGDTSQDCHIGIYRLQDGSAIDIGAAGGGGHLRWRRNDGTTGSAHCAQGRQLDQHAGMDRTAGREARVVFRLRRRADRVRWRAGPARRARHVTETTFDERGRSACRPPSSCHAAKRQGADRGARTWIGAFVGARHLFTAAATANRRHRCVRLRQARHGRVERRLFAELSAARQRCDRGGEGGEAHSWPPRRQSRLSGRQPGWLGRTARGEDRSGRLRHCRIWPRSVADRGGSRSDRARHDAPGLRRGRDGQGDGGCRRNRRDHSQRFPQRLRPPRRAARPLWRRALVQARPW